MQTTPHGISGQKFEQARRLVDIYMPQGSWQEGCLQKLHAYIFQLCFLNLIHPVGPYAAALGGGGGRSTGNGSEHCIQ
jgi:hypothetical protein